jgi:hypothetical protein
MKKAIALFGFFLFCATLIAQDEVTFNFSYKPERGLKKTAVIMFVNGVEVITVKNGSSAVYKATLDATKPVTVKAKFGMNKQSVTFLISPGNNCTLEASMFGRMLDLVVLSGGKLLPGTGSKSSLLVSNKDLSVSYTAEKTDASDTIRLKWLAVGGKIKGTSMSGAGTFLSLNKSGMKMIGFGAQYTISQSMLNFRVPEFKPGIRSWSSFVLGYSETVELYLSKSTIEIGGMDPYKSATFNYDIMLAPNIGYTLGFGKFKNETKWKGVAFELKYRPSLTYTMSASDAGESSSFSFNYMGFGLDVNFNSFTSNAARLAPKAQSKLTFFMLPPIKSLPLFINIGFGRTFYIRRG